MLKHSFWVDFFFLIWKNNKLKKIVCTRSEAEKLGGGEKFNCWWRLKWNRFEMWFDAQNWWLTWKEEEDFLELKAFLDFFNLKMEKNLLRVFLWKSFECLVKALMDNFEQITLLKKIALKLFRKIIFPLKLFHRIIQSFDFFQKLLMSS